MSTQPANYLGTEEVMIRYGLRDPRAARAVMDDAGAFLVGRRLLVRSEDLDRHENALRAQRRTRTPAPTRRPTRRTRRRAPAPQPLTNLPADWLESAG